MTKTVKIFSTSTCPYCTMAKDFLKNNNIVFEDVNVGTDQAAAKEMMDKSGQMGVPVLDIGGEIIVGFDKEAITRALGI
ncbi:MAG: NrdH-redoxin [Candidatus Omnitrophica bacterium]|nr:NrdH-redoxin [Candidatus Omnitrophota bacterium]MBU1932401.1 NrdH-redoxin [Candidatus Omnitrophota bacterium]